MGKFAQFSIFLLRGAGWVAVGVVIGFIVSFFFRPVGRFDTFVFAETMLGVVITGLSIVGAFIIALQWSTVTNTIMWRFATLFASKCVLGKEFWRAFLERLLLRRALQASLASGA